MITKDECITGTALFLVCATVQDSLAIAFLIGVSYGFYYLEKQAQALKGGGE